MRERMNKMQIGTILYTWLYGERVGVDQSGNKYYRSRRKNRWGREQRWCLYKESKEASIVPPEWNAWLHHTVNTPLTRLSAEMKYWQQQHQPNMTGTSEAYRPLGHAVKGGERSRATGDYEAWTPK